MGSFRNCHKMVHALTEGGGAKYPPHTEGTAGNPACAYCVVDGNPSVKRQGPSGLLVEGS